MRTVATLVLDAFIWGAIIYMGIAIYRASGRESEGKLRRLKVRDRITTTRVVWRNKRQLEQKMRAVVLKPGDGEANADLLSTQLTLLFGRALLARDARLALAVQLAMARTIDNEPKPVLMTDWHRKVLEAAAWN